MAFNGNIGKVSIGEENIVDMSHPPIIETFAIEKIITNYGGSFDIDGESNIVKAGCVVAIGKTDGKIKHYREAATNDRLSVIVNDVDTKKDSVANIILHGVVKGYKLFYVGGTAEAPTFNTGLDDDIRQKLQMNNIYVG